MTEERSTACLSNIVGLDPIVIELEKNHGIPPYVYIHDQDLTEDAVLTLLELCPIVCRQRGTKVYCVGNIRLYQLALQFIDRDQPIPVRMISTRKLDEINRLFAADRLLMPIVTNQGRSKNKWLFDLWKSLRPTLPHLWKKEPLSRIQSDNAFASLLDIDPRTLK